MSVPSPSARGGGSPRQLPQVEEDRPLPSVIVEDDASEAAPHTEVASMIGRHRKAPAASPPDADPHEQNTDIPITDSVPPPRSGGTEHLPRSALGGRGSARAESWRDADESEPAVLPDEDLTPFPDMDSDPYQAHLAAPGFHRSEPRQVPVRETTPPPRPEATDRIRVRHAPAPTAPPAPEPEAALEPLPAPTIQTQPRLERGGSSGVGAWVVIAVAALLVASGSLVYVFLGDRIVSTPQPKPKPVSRPRLGAGVIHVHSNPSESSVSIDGAKRCFSTPCRVAGLPLERELLLTLRSKGHSLWMQRVVLTSHQPKLLLRADLTPLPGYKKKTSPDPRAKAAPAVKAAARPTTPHPRSPTTPAKRRPTAAQARRKPPAARPPGKGKKRGNITITNSGSDAAVLTVDVRPWAEVHVNGKKVGYTPLERQVPPGKYVIGLKNPDQKYEKTFPIHVKKGKKIKIADVISPPKQ